MTRSAWRTALVWLMAVAFLASLLGVWKGLTIPRTIEEKHTRFSYEIKGDFSHRAYGVPAQNSSSPNPKYFSNLIESIEMSYNYRFLSEQPVNKVTAQVEVVAAIDAGLWQKDVPLLPLTPLTEENPTATLALDSSQIYDRITQISSEIGISASSPEITLKAIVHGVAETDQGDLELRFEHPLDFRKDRSTVQWGRELVRTRRGYYRGIKYEEVGTFGYSGTYKPNELFTDTTFESQAVPPSPPGALPLADSYPAEDLERIDGTFSFNVTSSPPLQSIQNELEVTAVLDTAGGPETFVLSPLSRQEGELAGFPLDTLLFYSVIGAAEQETATPPSPQKLTVTAKLHVTGESDVGSFDENLVHQQVLQLAPKAVQWVESKPKVMSDSVTETTKRSNPNYTNYRVLSISGAVFMGMVFGFVLWNHVQTGRFSPSPLELEAFSARQKHGEFLADVQTVPNLAENGAVVRFGSLEELFKAAEALLKPVLHWAGTGLHVYYVLDGNTLYQYVNRDASLNGDAEMPEMPLTTPPNDDSIPKAAEPTASGPDSTPAAESDFDQMRRLSRHYLEAGPAQETGGRSLFGMEEPDAGTKAPLD